MPIHHSCFKNPFEEKRQEAVWKDSLPYSEVYQDRFFQDDAISEIAKKAIYKKTGARGLRSILENILLKTMFELPDMENVIKVTVDRASVKGSSEPIVTYGKKSSTSVA